MKLIEWFLKLLQQLFASGPAPTLPNYSDLSPENSTNEPSTLAKATASKPSSAPVAASKKAPSAQDEFQAILDRRGIEYFTADEVFYKGASNAVHKNNTDPPRKLWNNILPTLDIADTARDLIAKPLRITSAYRSPAYNKSIGAGAASNSQHIQFRALDLAAPKATLRKLYAELMAMRARGYKIAIGRYPTFIHIDTRGTNASWGTATYQ